MERNKIHSESYLMKFNDSCYSPHRSTNAFESMVKDQFEASPVRFSVLQLVD